jgi:Flp pilus assembly protein TadG
MRGRRQLGQSITEFALVLPVLLVMLMAAANLGVLVSDKIVAVYASRQAARLASQLGNGQGVLTQSQVDLEVVRDATAASASFNYASIREVDIYAPLAADGVFDASTDRYDSYTFDASGNPIVSTFTLTLASRVQVPPDETSIGVRVLWQYSPPTGAGAFTIPVAEYSVMKVSPVLSG